MVLEKYAKQAIEPKSESFGVRLEKSLHDDFISLCNRFGLTTSEAIRYLILEEVNKDKAIKHEKNKSKTKKENEYNVNQTGSKQLLNGKNEEEITFVKHMNNSLFDNGIHTENKPKTKRKQQKSITQWVINKKAPCPVCGTWSNRKNFQRDHTAKHGYNNAFEFLEAHEEKVTEMYNEKIKEEQT
jgi:hypothetical protein